MQLFFFLQFNMLKCNTVANSGSKMQERLQAELKERFEEDFAEIAGPSEGFLLARPCVK